MLKVFQSSTILGIKVILAVKFMRIFIKCLIFLLVLACVSPFLLKGPDGKALIKIDKLNFPTVPSWAEVKSNFFDDPLSNQPSGNLRVYTWKDKQGVTHYSDQNDSQYKAELTEIKQLNIQPSLKQNNPDKPVSGSSIGLTTIPLQDVSKLIDDTRNVKKLMEGRGRQIEEALR